MEAIRKYLSKIQYLLPPALAVALFLTIFAVNGLYPFGGKSISWCDMNQQGIPILCEFKDVLSGKASLFLSHANAGGMNFYGLFIYYCTSPFNLLVVFVEKRDMALFMNVLVMLKTAASSATAYIYLQTKNGGKFSPINVALSLLYGFSGYVMVYYQIICWLDCVYVFPLFLLGLEKVDRGESFALYTVTLSLSMLFSYYVTYMVVVYALVRFAVGYAFGYRDKKRAYSFVIGSALAALVTAAVYVPVIFQYVGSARTGSVIDGLRSSAMTTSYDTTLLAVLCLAIVFPFMFSKSPSNDSSVDRLMVILTSVPLFLEPVNKMWQTGSYMSFPSRYAFMIIFSLIAFVGKTVASFEGGSALRPVIKYIIYGVITACFVGVAIFTINYSDGNYETLSKYSRSLWGSEASLDSFVKYYAVILVFAAIVYTLYRFRWLGKIFLGVAVFALAVNEAFFSAKLYMAAPSHETVKFQSMMDAADIVEDDGFYRVNSKYKMFSGSDGVGINAVGAMNYNTLSHYTSLTSQDYMTAVKSLGYSSYWMEVGDYGGTAFTDAFFVNKYTFVNSGLSSAKYKTDKYGLIENAVLPLGLVVGDGLETELTGERADMIEQLYEAVTGENGLIERFPLDFATFDGVSAKHENGVYTIDYADGETSGSVIYNLVVAGRKTLYFDCFDLYTNALRQHINESFDVKVNGRTVASKYPSQSSNGILRLGEFNNTTVRVELVLKKKFYGYSFGVFAEDVNVLNEAISRFSYNGLNVKGNSVYGDVTANAGQKLLIAIPYDKGYTFKVNGKKVVAEKVLTDFIAIPLEDGVNAVYAEYVPRGFAVGCVVSAVGVILFALALALRRKKVYNIEQGVFGKVCTGINVAALVGSITVVLVVYVLPMILVLI